MSNATYSIETEQSFLGCLLLDDTLRDKLDELD